MSLSLRGYRRYGEGFKREIVELYKQGRSASELQRLYDIKGTSTISKWVDHYDGGKRREIQYIRSMSDVDRLKQLEKEKAELERQLGRAHLKISYYESLVEVAEQHYRIDIKKTLDSGGELPSREAPKD